MLELVETHQRIHPRELEAYLGREREVNAWGGYSKATTRILQALHYRGLLRVAGRRDGIRIYETSTDAGEPIASEERLRKLVLLVTRLLEPVPERSLRTALQHLAHAAPSLEGRHSVVTRLIESGDLASAEVEGLKYVWPAGKLIRREADGEVRFLAPFDPLVWDRRRFEHFWGWAYRFEAYTPALKRKLGYYAMPMLWKDQVIGWANALRKEGKVAVEFGFVDREPQERAFRPALDAEVSRLEWFLRQKTGSEPS